MSVTTADLQTALWAAWTAGELPAKFTVLWDVADVTGFTTLHDQEASPGQPFPYCVLDQLRPATLDRMTGAAGYLQEVRDVTLLLHIYADEVTGDSRSAKQIAAYLAEEVMKVFGGHPITAATQTLTLTSGGTLLVLYQNDFGIRLDADKWEWQLEYLLKVDVPVRITA